MSRKFESILGTVGNTPVVRINRLAPPGVNLYVKIEAFNPLGSVKDRLALGVIEAAEKSGELKPGQTVIEATSGNTGIGLAMVCAAEGLPAGRDHGGAVQRRAPQADALPRRQGHPHAPGAARLRHGGQGHRARQDARLVPDAPVRERGQPRLSLPHDGARDRRRFQGREARLLGHGLRHRRHPEGRGPRARQGDARHQDHRLRARGRPAHRQRHRAGSQSRRLAGRSPPRLQAASHAGLDARFHPEDHGRCGGHEDHSQAGAGAGRRSHPHGQRAGDQGGHLRRHHLGGDASPARCALPRKRPRVPPSSPCCRTRASATCRRRCLPISRPT